MFTIIGRIGWFDFTRDFTISRYPARIDERQMELGEVNAHDLLTKRYITGPMEIQENSKTIQQKYDDKHQVMWKKNRELGLVRS